MYSNPDAIKVIRFEFKKGKRDPDRTTMWIGALGNVPNLVEPLRKVDAVNKKYGTHAELISPSVAAMMLTRPDLVVGFFEVSGACRIYFPTGVRAYEAPGKPLGEEVIYESEGHTIVFPTGAHKGKINVILSAEGLKPENFVCDNNLTIVDTTHADVKVTASEGFPVASGRCKINTGLYVPSGEIMPDNGAWWFHNAATEVRLARADAAFVGREVRALEVDMPSTAYVVTSIFLNHDPAADATVLARFADDDITRMRGLRGVQLSEK